MTAALLVGQLRKRGAEVFARPDGALCVRPRGIATAEEREALGRLKAEVLALLEVTGAYDALNDGEHDRLLREAADGDAIAMAVLGTLVAAESIALAAVPAGAVRHA